MTRTFVGLLHRLCIFSATLLITRGIALALILSIPIDHFEPLGYLSSSRYFYIFYLGGEILVLLFLLYLAISFTHYHVWLRSKNMTTYQHILIKKDKLSKTKINPKSAIQSVIARQSSFMSRQQDQASMDKESSQRDSQLGKDIVVNWKANKEWICLFSKG